MALPNDVIATTFPKPLVKAGDGVSEAFLLRRVRRGYPVPVVDCITEPLGLPRRHEYFGAGVVHVVYSDSRGVPLGKYRGAVFGRKCFGRRSGSVDACDNRDGTLRLKIFLHNDVP